MKIACGFDHAGVPLREVTFAAVQACGDEVIDLGTDSTEPVDYPDIASAVATTILAGEADRGILVCGSGAGVSIAACKFPDIRAASVHDTYTAHQAVEHDDMNVICLGARVIGPAYADEILRAFLGARFSTEERHRRRVAKILAIQERFSRQP